MKKTTKKLISIFLSLLMVLSLIPMGSMTAFAATEHSISISYSGVYTIPEGAYSAVGGDYFQVNNNSLDDVQIVFNNWSDTAPVETFNAGGDSIFVSPPIRAGRHVDDITVDEGIITFTLVLDQTADFTASHFFCSVCKGAGKSFIANYSGDVQDHYMSAHEDDIIAAFDCTHECIPANPCGDKNCPNTPVPTCGLCANCGHAANVHYSNGCGRCSGSFDPCSGINDYAGCVLEEGHTGNHADMIPCGKCLTCGHDASVHEDGGCNDCGIRDACFEYGSAEREFCALPTGHTGNHNSYLPKTYDGAKGLYINYTNSYGWRANDPRLAKYMSLNLSDTLINVSNYCYSNGTVYCDGVQVAYNAKVSGTVVKMDSDEIYICSDHTGDLGTLCEICTTDNAPEWLDTIVAKVDACSDELVADVEGTPATLSATVEGIAGGAFGDFVDAMNKKEYSQDDSVYTIEGELGSSILTVDVTLDANEDVESVKIVAVNEGVEYVNYTFAYPSTTPEWFDTIVAKVDASADKLVDDQGTPFANMLMGGKFADTFNQYESFEYDNDGSVYTIKGIGNGADGEFIITLDSNEDVASLVTNFYAAGTLMFAVTYTPAPPHTCTLAKKSGQAATCTKDGWKAYYQCKDKDCGKIYATNNASGKAYADLAAWKASKAGKIAKTGHTYTSKVTTPAKYSAEGVRTYTCSKCGNKYTKAIAKLKLTSDAKYSNSTKLDANFSVNSSTTNVTVKWGKVAGADGYMIYAGYCTKGSTAKRVMTVKNADTTSYSFTKIAGEKIDLTKSLKVYVVAYSTIDGKNVQVGKSITAHIIGGKSKKYSNPTKVTVKKNAVTLSVNKTSTISATVTYKDPSLKHISDSHAAEKRYRSSNKAVATVDANGKITAVGKGTCTIYVFAKNGTSAKVTVTVK